MPNTPKRPNVIIYADDLGFGRGELDWNAEIPATPLDVGFDYSFMMAATNDRVPCVYIDGLKVAGLDPDDPSRRPTTGRRRSPASRRAGTTSSCFA